MKRALRFLGLAALCGLGLSALAADNVAKVGTTEYATIDEAVEAWKATNNSTLTLLADVTLPDVVKFPSTTTHTLNLSTFTMTAASGKNAIEITKNGLTSAGTCLTINADATNPGGIDAGSYYCVYYSNSSGKDRPIITINNGVFRGAPPIWVKSPGNTNAPQLTVNKGRFISTGLYGIYSNRTLTQVNGGDFTGGGLGFYISADSSAYCRISGGTFDRVPATMDGTPTDQKFWYGTTRSTVGSKYVPVYDAKTYFNLDKRFVVTTGDVPEYGATLEKPTSGTLVNSAGPVYYQVASQAIGDWDYTRQLTLFVDESQAKSLTTSKTSTMALENGAKYTGTITLGTSAKLVVKGGLDGFVGKVVCSNPDYLVKKTEEGSQYTYSCISKKSCPVMIADPSGTECYYVDSDEINAAIVAAASGSTIEFRDGTYTVKKTLADGETLTLVNAAGHYDYATLVKGAAACDLTTEVSEDGKTVVIKSAKNDAKCQAVIVDADGNPTYYATFADAVKGAAEKGTVSVNREIAAGEEVVIAGKEVTLDLAGQVVKADILFTGDANDFIIDSVGGGKVLGTISVAEGCTLKIYAGTFNQEIPAAWVAAEDAEGNPLCVVRQDDGTFKVIANKVEVKEIEITEQNVKIVDEKGETVVVPEEKVAAAQAAIIEANTKLQDAIANVPPVDTGIEKAAKEAVVTPSGEVVAGAAKANVVGALQEALKEAAKTEDIPVEAANQITASSDISERLEIKVDSEVTKVNDSENQPDKMEANLEVVVWDVKPIVKTVITIGEGEGAEEKIIETQLPDEEVKKNPVTFRLAVADPQATGAYVRHIGHDEFEDETIFCKVQGPAGGRYVELTVDHFSLFEVRTTGEVVEDLDDAVGIINLGVPSAGKELAAGVPFTTAGTTAKLDDLVMTGLANGDKILVQNGDDYTTYTFNGTTWGNVELAPGTTFWYQSANGSANPLTLAGLVTDSVSTAVAAGDAAAPKATLLVNPFNTAADLVAAVGSAAAEGDQIAFAGDNGGKDVRYVFKGGKWGYYTKPAAVTAADIYLADDVFNQVTAISVPGGKGAWYVSKGGNPTVAWSAAGAAVASEQIAASEAQAYGAIDWFVALNAADMDSFPHEGIRLVGYGADGEVFRYGRDFTADQFAASNTVFLGLGGGTGAAASFAVELLDAEDNVIAVSEPVTDLGNALTATYAGSKAPVTATEPVQFTNFGADDNGEFAYLREAFAGKGIVKALADGCEVFLTNDVTGPVTLAANLGAVTLDLNGHSITGTVATVDADAGNAIVIGGSIAGAAIPTALLVKNTGAPTAKVVGGNGADGVYAKNGAAAIAYDPESDVTVEGNGLVQAGENGVAATAWAWCLCDTAPADPVDLPYGVSYEESTGKYLFWGNVAGAAKFDFGDLAGWTVTDDTIHFVDGPVTAACLTVSASAPDTLKFVGGVETLLVAEGDASIFDVTATEGQARSWEKLGFTCDAEKTGAQIAQCGGAICMKGGQMTVVDCNFGACTANENGGAIAAIGLAADSLVTNSAFAYNAGSEGNGLGGAIYATAKADGLKLTVVDSTFVGNMAENGGAIAVYPANIGDEKPIALVIRNGAFEGNCSWNVGGAIAAFGDVEVEEGTTEFAGNAAAIAGGAICITSYNNIETTVAAVNLGRGVKFVGNVVSNGVLATTGGAISFELPGGTLSATGVAFVANAAMSGDDNWGAIGGAIEASFCKNAVIDTCVFDDNEVVGLGDGVFGGAAISAFGSEDSSIIVRNSTFRRSDTEAIYVAGTPTKLVNCVVVGNGDGVTYADIAAFDTTLDMSYTAYGTLVTDNTEVTESNDLANRNAGIYDGDTLKLNPVGFNPVAVFGLTQEGVHDFEGTQYGYDGYSWSMGAFETVTVKLTVTVTGDREYNGNTSSNGIAQFEFALSTNGVAVTDEFCAELGDVKAAFAVTAWAYGDKNVGFYASTNAADTAKVIATVALVEVEKEVLLNALDFVYEGTISPTVNGLAMTIEPLDYAWTGSEIVPTSVTVIDTLSGDPLVEGVDYRITYGDNVEPTDSAKVIVTGSRNYYGGTAVSNFWITAYLVNHVFDGEVLGTETFGATGGQKVVGHELVEIPAGYCFDWQNSETNGIALKIGEGGLTAIDVLYWTDSNNDKVPDKFQRKLPLKVVNGTWDATDAYDKTAWVTLEKNGKWDVTGTGSVSIPDVTAGIAASGYTKTGAGWLVFQNNKFTVETDPTSISVDNGTAFLLYSYLRSSNGGGRTGGGRIGRGGASETTYTLEDMYKARLAITTFSVSGNKLTLGTKLTVVDTTANDKKIVDGPLADTTVKIEWSKTPGGETESVIEPTTDEDGNATFAKPDADSAFFKIAE